MLKKIVLLAFPTLLFATEKPNILNNPFLNKQIEQLIKNAVDKIVKEEIDKIKTEYRLKYEQQIMQLQLRNLEAKKKILELQKEIMQLKEKLTKNSKVKREENKISTIEVSGVIGVGDKAILLLKNNGTLKVGSRIGNYLVVHINTQEHKIIVKDNKGQIKVINYTLNG